MSDEHNDDTKHVQYEQTAQPSGGKHNSSLVRFGKITALLMLACFVIIACALGFLGYLWYGDADKDIWKRIVLNNFAARAITLTSTAIRTSVALQGGFCLSMVVAIAMERSQIPVSMLTDASMARSGDKTGTVSMLKDIILPMLQKGRGGGLLLHGIIIPTLLLILAIVNLTQFTSTALLSDVSLQLIPGYNKSSSLVYDFQVTYSRAFIGDTPYPFLVYNYGKNEYQIWSTRNPLNWPAFAEYSEPPIQRRNVADTGMSLRAFLPFAAAADRQSIRNYTGKAALMDSRVTCQQPIINHLTATQILNGSYTILIEGDLSPSTTTPRMDTRTYPSNSSVPFHCLVDQSCFFICQLINDAVAWGEGFSYSGGLISEFRQFPPVAGQDNSGAAYLIGVQSDGGYSWSSEYTVQSIYAINEAIGSVKKRQPLSTGGPGATYVGDFGFTLCYTALDVQNRFVNLYSDTNRTEVAAYYKTNVSYGYDVAVVQNLLVSYPINSSNVPSKESRGLLNISPQSNWSAPESTAAGTDGPIQLTSVKSLNLSTSAIYDLKPLSWIPYTLQMVFNPYSTTFGNCTVPLDPAFSSVLGLNSIQGVVQYEQPQSWMQDLFYSIITSENNTAVALQSVLTSLAGVAYYEYLQLYDKADNVSQSFFVEAESAGGQLGTKRTATPRGLIAVLVVLAFHTLLCIIITIVFIMYSKLTRLSDGWQAVAHISTSEHTRAALGQAAKMDSSRKAVDHELKHRGIGDVSVYLTEEGGNVVLKYE